MKPIHSMTGYAAVSQTFDTTGPRTGHVLHMELRAVNARFLDLSFRCSDDLRFLETPLRERIAVTVMRGKLECRLNLISPFEDGRSLAVNTALIKQLILAQQAIHTIAAQAAPLTTHEILRWPGMLENITLPPETLQKAAMQLVATALEELQATRRREGEKLAATMQHQATDMRNLAAKIAPALPTVLADYEARISNRLRETVTLLDEERIRQEVGVLAARLDVAEEATRLIAHLDELERILTLGGAVGKRLDFLAQELNREANTLASKSISTGITAIALDLKLLIEQMREQAQNLE